MMEKIRCEWVDLNDTLMVKYHDEEYGVKRKGLIPYFEILSLEAFQAGLSWRTILHKRKAFQKAFYSFDPKKVVKMDEADVLRLLEDEGIVRSKRKIEATISNAKIALEIEKELGFENFINSHSSGKALSVALKQRGFKFVGETICSEYLTVLGILPAHEKTCFRYHELKVDDA